MSIIPQLVNIQNALQSSVVEQIRNDIKKFQSAEKLTDQDYKMIQGYIQSISETCEKFTQDNQHVERNDDGITDADIRMYQGLKSMYQDYLKDLEKLQDQIVGNGNESADVLSYIEKELPYTTQTERKLYIDNVINNGKDKLEKSPELLNAIGDLCILDSSMQANLQSYLELLIKIGFTQTELAAKIPSVILNSNLKSNNNLDIVEPSIASETGIEQKTVSESLGNGTQVEIEDDSKKKISFSKYLKKGDTDLKDQELNDSSKRESAKVTENVDDTVEEPAPKKVKVSNSLNSEVRSILKISDKPSKKSKVKRKLKFNDDSQLVKVYGEGLPKDGLQLSPSDLKDFLRPFKEGEPREVFAAENTVKRARSLVIVLSSNIEDVSDISNTKNGPVKCTTVTPSKYRVNFTNFSHDFKNPAREPVTLDDSKDKSSPIIARAFGKNSLLLRKDRGGMPYKRSPEIVSNNYPPRPPKK